MRALGLSAQLDGKRFRVTGILADVHAKADDPELSKAFSYVASPNDTEAMQLDKLYRSLESQLPLVKPDAIVIRTMDFTLKPRTDVITRRGRIEGVLGAASQAACHSTHFLNGRRVGEVCGGSKSDVEHRAATAIGDALKEPGAAALAGLVV
jgi:hypothetical protein